MMSGSPGRGYFQVSSFGRPTLVVVRYMLPTRRWSWRKVAILRESGDQRSTGLSLWVQPALSVA